MENSIASGQFLCRQRFAAADFRNRGDDMREMQKLMAEILLCEPDALPSDSTPLRDLKGWDSLKHVLLVVELEKRLDHQLSAEEIQRIVTLDDVASVMREKVADA